jgi:hypothetical protein
MITLTQTDALVLTLTCTNHDLTGAVLQTHFKTASGADLIIPSGQHTVDPDQVSNKGKFTVSLLTTDTAQMAVGTQLNFLTKVTQGGSIVHFHGRKLLNVKKSTLD